MKPGKKSPAKKSSKKSESNSDQIEKTKKRLENQQKALKKIIQSFTKGNSDNI